MYMARQTKIQTASFALSTSKTSFSTQKIKSKLYVPIILSSLDDTVPKEKLVCTIEGCNKTFNKPSLLRSHTCRHSGKVCYVCDEPSCKKHFTTRIALHRHKRLHTGEKPYECEQCGKNFSRSDNLAKHLRVHLKPTKPVLLKSSDEEDYNEGDTNDTTDAIEVLVKQEIDMDADHQFRDECQPEVSEIEIKQDTITETSLPAYVKEEDVSQENTNVLASSTDAIGVLVKKEIDMEADYQFTEDCHPEVSEIEIKQETITETSLPAYYNSDYPTIEKRFTCPIDGCGKLFKTQNELKRHSMVHTGEKPFECQQCQKRFMRKDYLTKHLKMHSRLKTLKAAS